MAELRRSGPWWASLTCESGPSFWFNRGQAVVGRGLRSALETLFATNLRSWARLAKDTAAKPGMLSREDVCDQPGVTESHYPIPAEEM